MNSIGIKLSPSCPLSLGFAGEKDGVRGIGLWIAT
jgi:hypothetical protein